MIQLSYPKADPNATKEPIRLDYDQRGRCFVVLMPKSHPNRLEISADVRALPDRVFDSDGDRWLVGATTRHHAIAVRLLVTKHDGLASVAARKKVSELEGDQGRALLKASRVIETNFHVPNLARKLRPYQCAGVEYGIMASGRTFITDEPGVGKTAQAIALLEHFDAYPGLVICPNSAKYNWEQELADWLPHRQVSVIDSGSTWRGGADIYVMNYDGLASGWNDVASVFHPEGVSEKDARGFLNMIGFKVGSYESRATRRLRNCIITAESMKIFKRVMKDYPPEKQYRLDISGKRVAFSTSFKQVLEVRPRGLVCDEFHYLGSNKSQRTSAVLDMVKILGEELATRLLLSGTPVNNKVKEWIPPLQILGRLDDLGGWPLINQRYCGAVKTSFGWEHPSADPEELHLKEFNELLRSTCMIRRRKTEVLKDLPPKTRIKVLVDLEMKEYQKKEREVIGWLQAQLGLEQSSQKQAEALMRLNSLRQIIGKAKLKVAFQWIEDFFQSGEKLIVFALSRDLQEAIYEKFKDIAVRVHGDDAPKERFAQVQRFQTDPRIGLIVVSLKAGREALNITAASDELFVDMDWTSTAHDQAEDRAWRSGQLKPVTAFYLLGKGTVEEDQWKIIEYKRGIVSTSADGDISTAVQTETSNIVEISQRLVKKTLIN